MPTPATTGQLRVNIADMQIGDYIVCKYNASSGAVGTFSELGTSTATEIPITGTATPNGTFYFVKVAKGLLVADRVVQVSISWDTLNAGKYIEGKTMTLGTTSGILRSLTGGVAYADQYGNKSLTDQGYGGWSTSNEWDRFIVGFPQELIQNEKTLNDVFHWNGVATWCQDTPINGLPHHGGSISGASNHRIWRGYPSGATGTVRQSVNYGNFSTSNVSATNIGFRPIFEYVE